MRQVWKARGTRLGRTDPLPRGAQLGRAGWTLPGIYSRPFRCTTRCAFGGALSNHNREGVRSETADHQLKRMFTPSGHALPGAKYLLVQGLFAVTAASAA